MLWSDNWIRPRVGYATSKAAVLYQNKLNTGGDKSFRFDAVVGNTGYRGRYLWKLADNMDNNAAQCYEWYYKQPLASVLDYIKRFGPSQCPRRRGQARRDQGFRFYKSGPNGACYVGRATFSIVYSSYSFFVICCYDYQRGALIRENNPSSRELSTHTYISTAYPWYMLYNRYYRNLARYNAFDYDNLAFDHCCLKSSLCNLFEEKRPMMIYGSYVPPSLGMSIGIFNYCMTF